MAGKRANQVDVAVGQRIRLFRRNATLSQTELGKRIGVSAQQVQKYESGANRVGVGRLMQIAATLDVPIMDFFDRLAPRSWPQQQAVHLSAVMTAPSAEELVRAFLHVSDPAIQSAIVNIAQALTHKPRRQKS